MPEQFQILAQARFSRPLERIARWGIALPYREPAGVGLTIHSGDESLIYTAVDADRQFRRFEDIPPLVVKALLIMENRELANPSDVRANPVVEWDRLAKAGLSYAGTKLGLPVRLEGGSTLATQIDKYRHSMNGTTSSPLDKLQQITGASLKVYRLGPDTRLPRHEIIQDYLNTVPLAAAPVFGEVHGIGEGLEAWFGMKLDKVMRALETPGNTALKARAFKHVVSLIASVRAPSHYLLHHRAALEKRTNFYVRSLASSGVIDKEFAARIKSTPLSFLPAATSGQQPLTANQKTANAIRNRLSILLGVPSLYELDRLHLNVQSSIDSRLQRSVLETFRQLQESEFLASEGLTGERLLKYGDPHDVLYSFLLFEVVPEGNALVVQVDTLKQPFDLNTGMKLELGSTAKLRTLAHYLDVVASLHSQLASRTPGTLARLARDARDPLTRWVAESLIQDPGLKLETIIDKALERKYSANPGERFFTGGGVHVFHNFDSKDNHRILTLREATRRSINLVYIRLMRDLVRFHQARLDYDAEAVLKDPKHPVRTRMLKDIAEGEAHDFLLKAYREYRSKAPLEITSRLLGRRAADPRSLTVLFYAWQLNHKLELTAWIDRFGTVDSRLIPGLMRGYGNPRLNLADYAFLLGKHPLDLWCAGQLLRNPQLTREELFRRSGPARQIASAWLFKTRNRRAQDLRLRTRIEQDAFDRMTVYWQRFGFPFERLVPSLATAIGSSSDRPWALAELMGIIVNNGYQQPTVLVRRLDFAQHTPYETSMGLSARSGERVMAEPVAVALKSVLAEVVESGTARRLADTFKTADGRLIPIGGKTGSGDNEFKTLGPGGAVISARTVNRTATFVFYIGDRYFGVLTAFVEGKKADQYRFTSALPVAILKLLAPAIASKLNTHLALGC